MEASEAGSSGAMEAAVTRPCACRHRSHVHKHLMQGAQATLGLAVELNIRLDNANLRQTLRTYSISLQAPESPPRKGPFVSWKWPLNSCFCQSYKRGERTPGLVYWDFKASRRLLLTPPTAPPCRTRVRNRILCPPGRWSTGAWRGCRAQGGPRGAASWEGMVSGKEAPVCPALHLEGGFHAPVVGRPVPDLRLEAGGVLGSCTSVGRPCQILPMYTMSPVAPHSSQEVLRGPRKLATGLRPACRAPQSLHSRGKQRKQLSGSTLQISPQK